MSLQLDKVSSDRYKTILSNMTTSELLNLASYRQKALNPDVSINQVKLELIDSTTTSDDLINIVSLMMLAGV